MGLGFGILLSLGLLILFLYYVFEPSSRLYHSQGERPKKTLHGHAIVENLNENISTSSFPENIVEYLKKSLKPQTDDHRVLVKMSQPENPQIAEFDFISPTQDVEWINVISARFFIALKSNDYFVCFCNFKLETKRMRAHVKTHECKIKFKWKCHSGFFLFSNSRLN